MNGLDTLNLRLLVCNGVKQETAEAIMERIRDLEQQAGDLAGRLGTVTAQRDQLERWKKEMLEVERWWNKIDEYVRGQQDARLGDHVSAIALRMLKERRELLDYIDGLNAIRAAWQNKAR